MKTITVGILPQAQIRARMLSTGNTADFNGLTEYLLAVLVFGCSDEREGVKQLKVRLLCVIRPFSGIRNEESVSHSLKKLL